MSDHPIDTMGGEVSRRHVLGVLGVAAAGVVTGGRLAPARDAVAAVNGLGALDCVATPQQTEGPYFVDELLNRSDIRLDPATSAIKEGLPLRLRINVSRVDGAACSPLEGALVDVWQCDALGVYSDVRDFQGRFDTRGQRFLRGVQTTDAGGGIEFVTIYPGWYPGRTVHIHFKVRVPEGERRGHELTSQLYFDDTVTDQVFARPPYDANGARDTRNAQDGIFRRGGSGSHLLLLRLTPEGEGYLGTFNVGLRMS